MGNCDQLGDRVLKQVPTGDVGIECLCRLSERTIKYGVRCFQSNILVLAFHELDLTLNSTRRCSASNLFHVFGNRKWPKANNTTGATSPQSNWALVLQQCLQLFAHQSDPY